MFFWLPPKAGGCTDASPLLIEERVDTIGVLRRSTLPEQETDMLFEILVVVA